MKSTPFLALSAMLSLAACSAEAPVPQASEAASAGASETVAAPMPASDTVSEVLPTASPTPAAITTFPAPMLGRWGLVPADCTSQKGDNKGMITVTDREIRFYESVARIDRVKDSSANRVRAALAYDGEGMQWSRDVQLEAKPAKRQLVLQEYGEDAVQGPRTYTRCK